MMTHAADISATAHLSQVVEDFCRFAEAAASADCAPDEKTAAWGLQETLAHLVYHHEIYAAQTEAAVTGCPAPLPKGAFNDLNALAVELLGSEPPARLIARLRSANARLCRQYDEHDLGETAVQVKKGSTAWKLNNLLPAVASHIQTHQKQLEK